MQVKQQKLYGLVLILGFALVIIGLGGGLFKQTAPWIEQWQHKAFLSLCHQLPDRSFWFNEQPMAVCSRCIGIYSGFALGWLGLPLIGMIDKTFVWSMKNLAVIILLVNFIDAGADFIGLWKNTLASRALLGSLLGASTALIFIGDFFHH